MDLDYRAIGLAPGAEDILIFYIDLTTYGILDQDKRHLLRYLAEGQSPREIAHLLGLSERTTYRRIDALRQRLEGYVHAA